MNLLLTLTMASSCMAAFLPFLPPIINSLRKNSQKPARKGKAIRNNNGTKLINNLAAQIKASNAASNKANAQTRQELVKQKKVLKSVIDKHISFTKKEISRLNAMLAKNTRELVRQNKTKLPMSANLKHQLAQIKKNQQTQKQIEAQISKITRNMNTFEATLKNLVNQGLYLNKKSTMREIGKVTAELKSWILKYFAAQIKSVNLNLKGVSTRIQGLQKIQRAAISSVKKQEQLIRQDQNLRKKITSMGKQNKSVVAGLRRRQAKNLATLQSRYQKAKAEQAKNAQKAIKDIGRLKQLNSQLANQSKSLQYRLNTLSKRLNSDKSAISKNQSKYREIIKKLAIASGKCRYEAERLAEENEKLKKFDEADPIDLYINHLSRSESDGAEHILKNVNDPDINRSGDSVIDKFLQNTSRNNQKQFGRSSGSQSLDGPFDY